MIPRRISLDVKLENAPDNKKYSIWNLLWYSKLTPALLTLASALLLSWYIPLQNHKYQKLRDDYKEKVSAVDFFSKSFTEQVGFYNSYKHNLCKSENEKNIEHKKLLLEKAEKYYSQIIESKYNYELGISMIRIYFADKLDSIDLINYEKLINVFFSSENRIDINTSDDLCVINNSYENNFAALSDKYNEIFAKLTLIIKEAK